MSVVRADRLLAENLSALLHARGQNQKDLAMWCHHTEPWISGFLRGVRGVRLTDLDRMADFFGLATYQLFQPGISVVTERRRGAERRSGRDRRISMAQRVMNELTAQIDSKRPPRRGRNRRQRDDPKKP